MLKIENPTIFAKCVADALATIDANSQLNTGDKMRAVNAVAKAVSRIESDGWCMEYSGDDDRLIIWSQTSNLVYELSPDRSCSCLAALNGTICWHKAAKRLIERYNAARQVSIVRLDPSEMPYLKPSARRPVEFCGGLQI